MQIYLLFKTLHLVAMVAWFAGLFYQVRLYVYHAEAQEKDSPDSAVLIAQYLMMESRLYKIILRPAMLMTWVFGLSMIFYLGWEWFKVNHWLHAKLFLVLLLSGYSSYLGKILIRHEQGEKVMSSYHFRLFNEVPTLFLLAIILLAVYKNLTNFGYTFMVIILFGVLLFLFTKMYKRIRLKNKPK